MIFNFEETHMNKSLKDIVILAKPNDSLQTVISNMARCGEKYFGLSLVVDDNLVLQGVFSNGDILRLIADGENLRQEVKNVMRRDPITAFCDDSENVILDKVQIEVSTRTLGKRFFTRYVPLIDSHGVVHDVVDVYALLSRSTRQEQPLRYGLGFVGLTLSVALLVVDTLYLVSIPIQHYRLLNGRMSTNHVCRT